MFLSQCFIWEIMLKLYHPLPQSTRRWFDPPVLIRRRRAADTLNGAMSDCSS